MVKKWRSKGKWFNHLISVHNYYPLEIRIKKVVYKRIGPATEAEESEDLESMDSSEIQNKH